MPVCDGLTAVGMIREYEATGRLTRKKVIAVTGNARQEQLDVCRAAGFQHGIAIKVRHIHFLFVHLLTGLLAISLTGAACFDSRSADDTLNIR